MLEVGIQLTQDVDINLIVDYAATGTRSQEGPCGPVHDASGTMRVDIAQRDYLGTHRAPEAKGDIIDSKEPNPGDPSDKAIYRIKQILKVCVSAAI